MSKKKKPKPIDYEEKDSIRKTIGWHIDQIGELHKQLKPHKNPRGLVAGTNMKGDVAFLFFNGNVDEMFIVAEFIKEMDSEESMGGESLSTNTAKDTAKNE